ncbi:MULTISPECIES: DUF4406 domain-containing protein [unclassified Phyllobacterium]|uniref:DUF4406 domain-containing protein n=1 Tax=Phyllobacterium TaxID=28100 RepID=UPI000DD8078A|nr:MULTISPECIES: DUF4406 domain-containing protein [unclassified Phyllobacterium]MBA8900691.1 hypothetical protein [Phyllobacterium sp. P30BS-XVII]UGX86627.1 DUF4406 domain-containing protein [Phyllobacterium sp. T1293]
MLILIAGPYRSGTNDDADKMAANLQRLEEASWPLFQAGHLPMIGEWVALPVWNAAGGRQVGDELYDQIFHPAAGRLIALCDAILRLPGESKGADNDVRLANERGIPVYYRLEDVPGYVAGTSSGRFSVAK